MSNFQKRHYEELAEMLNTCHIDMQTKKIVSDSLARILKRDNPKFDVCKFRKASGTEGA